MVFTLEPLCGNCMDGKNHCVNGQLKKNLADFTHIFSVSTIEAILLVRHAFSRQDMYDVHRFDARKILWHMGIQLKKYTTFYYMTLGSFMLKTRWRPNKNL